MAIIEGTYGTPLTVSGAPVAGTDAVQTLNIGGTPTGGTFRLSHEGVPTTSIAWSNVNATLLTAIQNALNALATIGTGGVAVTAGTMVSGIGTALITFSGANLGKNPQATITVHSNALTGTTPTVSVTTTTPGVAATQRGAAKGALLIDTTNGTLYQNTGTATAPVWGTRT